MMEQFNLLVSNTLIAIVCWVVGGMTEVVRRDPTIGFAMDSFTDKQMHKLIKQAMKRGMVWGGFYFTLYLCYRQL